MGGRRGRQGLVVLLAVASGASACAGVSPAAHRTPAPAVSTSATAGAALTPEVPPVASLHRLGVWQPVNGYAVPAAIAGQGLASLRRAGGAATLVYRGSASIPLRLWFRGWHHVGDPDAHGGYVVDAYQGRSNAAGKLFEVTAPNGARLDFVHRLVPGEALNNSFAAVSLDGRWLVSGEWGTVRRLLVFPAPLGRRASGPLSLAGVIRLDRPVRAVQGCDFAAPARLVCSSDDNGRPSRLVSSGGQLLQVDLVDRASDGRPTRGVVTALGPLPRRAACAGAPEVEGLDVATATGTLRVEVIGPQACAHGIVYVYRHR